MIPNRATRGWMGAVADVNDDLVISFDTTDATPNAVTQLVQALTYSNSNTNNHWTINTV